MENTEGPGRCGTVTAVCHSETKGTPKRDDGCGLLVEDHGLAGDAHAGSGRRQVSLLSLQRIEAFNAAGGRVQPGDFGENLILDGIDLSALSAGTRLRIGPAILEVTQIGKECRQHCAIYQRMGDCIMPREGIFARVVSGGPVAAGDAARVLS